MDASRAERALANGDASRMERALSEIGCNALGRRCAEHVLAKMDASRAERALSENKDGHLARGACPKRNWMHGRARSAHLREKGYTARGVAELPVAKTDELRARSAPSAKMGENG